MADGQEPKSLSRVQMEMVLTPLRNLIFCAENKDLEDWMETMRRVSASTSDESSDHPHQGRDGKKALNTAGQHTFNPLQHVRPLYCNVCREGLSCVSKPAAVLQNGKSCEVCKCRIHQGCLKKVSTNCKWTTLASIGDDIIEEDSGEIKMPHQWMEGNLPVNAKCVVCDKTCGSIRRMQDLRCLWCHSMVHASCKENLSKECNLGEWRVSILPPTAITSLDSDGYWQATKPPRTSPLLVFINSKSGAKQGTKIIRKFRRLLNPAQVFDLMNGGPKMGLRLFQNFESFRVLVCGGDGSIAWVLNEIDRLNLRNQCQVGVLPLGTGNDLARVLGWRTAFDDDTQLPSVLEKLEHAQIKMLDRWSIFAYETTVLGHRRLSAHHFEPITNYEDSVADHLSRILHSDSLNVVISSAMVLCTTIKEFIAKVASSNNCCIGVPRENRTDDDVMTTKCSTLVKKLDALLAILEEESRRYNSSGLRFDRDRLHRAEDSPDEMFKSEDLEIDRRNSNPEKAFVFPPDNNGQPSLYYRRRNTKGQASFSTKEQLTNRANSLKRAIRQVIEHTERAVDEQNSQTSEFDQQNQFPFDNLRAAVDNRAEEQAAKEAEVAQAAHPVRPFNIPLITTDEDEVFESDSDDVDDDVTDDVTDDHHFKLDSLQMPARDNVTSLSVPSFHGFFSLDGDLSSACSSPGPATPISGWSPLPCRTCRQCPPSPSLSMRIGGEKGSEGSRHLSTLSAAVNRSDSVSILSSCGERSKDSSPTFPLLNIPLLNALPHRSSNAGDGSSEGFISKMLLANADTLCAAASPFAEVNDLSLDDCIEKCVMNNYFGIGLDAKITLDFHNKREEHPEKCCSRTKNMMWYGVLGGRQIVQRKCKNLEQTVRLECDGQLIPLPNLQGIVVLNIQSYMGGINFWGGRKEDDNFLDLSFDDRILEVVAVFGSVQLGLSRVVNLQKHRIAQCRSVRITIVGEEGVPVQVDGEAWIQPPGFISIVHKNRAQMLTRDKVFEEALKTWTEKKKIEHPINSKHYVLSDDELAILQSFVRTTEMFVKSVKVDLLSNRSLDQDLFHLASQASGFLERISSQGQLFKPVSRKQVSDLVSSVRTLYNETRLLLSDKASSSSVHHDEMFEESLSSMDAEIKRVHEIGGLPHFHVIEEEASELRKNRMKWRSKLRWKFSRGGKRDKQKDRHALLVMEWSTSDVREWLRDIDLDEYCDLFTAHDIRGRELMSLGRGDLKELGITKMGHLKRIQHAIKDIKDIKSEARRRAAKINRNKEK